MNFTMQKIFIGILSVTFVILIFFAFGGENQETITQPKNSPKSLLNKQGEKIANRHLFLTNEKIKVEEEKMRIQADSINQQSQNSSKAQTKNLQSKTEDDWGPQPTPSEMHGSEAVFETPDEVIQRQLYEKQLDAAYDEQYREAYAKEFIENARKHGYEIKLNSDFQVISVKKIK